MLSFSNPKITKSLMVADMEAHAFQDRLIAGIYAGEINGEFRGCAVGCSIHTINQTLGTRHAHGEHGGVKVMAEGCGVSETFIRDVIAGRRVPSPKVLDGLGFQRQVTVDYVPLVDGKPETPARRRVEYEQFSPHDLSDIRVMHPDVFARLERGDPVYADELE